MFTFISIRTRNFALVSGVMVALLAAAASTGCGREEKKPAGPSLYERLGGLAPISVVVSDFIDVLVSDRVVEPKPGD